jgi:mono/diheme cytochrome c family protein
LKTSRVAFAAYSLFLALAVASAQTSSTPVTGLTSNPAYEKNCAHCHGKTAKGRKFGGPSLISIKVASASEDDLRNIIANGKGHMPKYDGKLRDEEINTLVRQIQSLNRK